MRPCLRCEADGSCPTQGRTVTDPHGHSPRLACQGPDGLRQRASAWAKHASSARAPFVYSTTPSGGARSQCVGFNRSTARPATGPGCSAPGRHLREGQDEDNLTALVLHLKRAVPPIADRAKTRSPHQVTRGRLDMRGSAFGRVREGPDRSREDRRGQGVTFGKTTLLKLERVQGGSSPERAQVLVRRGQL